MVLTQYHQYNGERKWKSEDGLSLICGELWKPEGLFGSTWNGFYLLKAEGRKAEDQARTLFWGDESSSSEGWILNSSKSAGPRSGTYLGRSGTQNLVQVHLDQCTRKPQVPRFPRTSFAHRSVQKQEQISFGWMHSFPILSGRKIWSSLNSHGAKKLYTFMTLPQGCVNSPILCYNVVWRDVDHLDTFSNITLVSYVNDIILTGYDEQDVASWLEALVTLWGFLPSTTPWSHSRAPYNQLNI